MKRLGPLQRLAVSAAMALCVVVAVAAPVVGPSVPVWAANVAPKAGDNCPLPDGTTGKLELDLHTCCPASASQANGASCLFAKYINPLVNLLSAAVMLVVVIAIIYGGIEYSSSAGDPQKAANGKQRIVNALLGLLAYALLYAFLQFLVPGGAFNA